MLAIFRTLVTSKGIVNLIFKIYFDSFVQFRIHFAILYKAINLLHDTMKTTPEHDQRMAKTIFAAVYPYYVKKVESKGRTVQELHQVIQWLTGFDEHKLKELIDEKVTYATFFERATLNPNAHLITGVICGYRVEEIENPVTRQARYMDKLIDELAKGRKMEKILRG